jgi:hypothetical protein
MLKYFGALLLSASLGTTVASAQVVPFKTHNPAVITLPGNPTAALHSQSAIHDAAKASLPAGASVGTITRLPWSAVLTQILGRSGGRRRDIAPGRQIYVVEISAPQGISGRNVHFANATGYQFVDAETGALLGVVLRGKIDHRGFGSR